MTILAVLFLISTSILYLGLIAIRGAFETLMLFVSEHPTSDEKPNAETIMYSVAGFIIGVIGGILYYQVCASTVRNILLPRHPVEEPVLFGISMILTSIIFAGGLFTVPSFGETFGPGRTNVIWMKGPVIIAFIVLVIYLILKVPMILP